MLDILLPNHRDFLFYYGIDIFGFFVNIQLPANRLRSIGPPVSRLQTIGPYVNRMLSIEPATYFVKTNLGITIYM